MSELPIFSPLAKMLLRAIMQRYHQPKNEQRGLLEMFGKPEASNEWANALYWLEREGFATREFAQWTKPTPLADWAEEMGLLDD